MIPNHIFWPIIGRSSLYATGVTRVQGVVLSRIGRHGHFRSRDKDGGHAIGSAMAQNPLQLRKLDYCIFYRTGVINNIQS